MTSIDRHSLMCAHATLHSGMLMDYTVHTMENGSRLRMGVCTSVLTMPLYLSAKLTRHEMKDKKLWRLNRKKRSPSEVRERSRWVPE